MRRLQSGDRRTFFTSSWALVFFCAAFLTGCRQKASGDHRPRLIGGGLPVNSSVTLLVSAENKNYHAGEPVVVSLSFNNNSKDRFWIIGEPCLLDVSSATRIDPDGTRHVVTLTYPNMGYMGSGGGPWWGKSPFLPGTSEYGKLKMNRDPDDVNRQCPIYDLDLPGRYLFRAFGLISGKEGLNKMQRTKETSFEFGIISPNSVENSGKIKISGE
jgi:hypothetical protein